MQEAIGIQRQEILAIQFLGVLEGTVEEANLFEAEGPDFQRDLRLDFQLGIVIRQRIGRCDDAVMHSRALTVTSVVHTCRTIVDLLMGFVRVRNHEAVS